MKRLSFLAALFGGCAAAQEKFTILDNPPLTYWNDETCPKPNIGITTPSGKKSCIVPMRPGTTRKYANNECPVCGTMAEPWSRPIHRKGEMMPTQCGPLEWCVSAIFYYHEDTPYGPTERIARCRTCNAAFWQDAEVKP